MSEQTMLIESVMTSPEAIGAAAAIAGTWPRVQEQLLDELRKQLLDIKPENWVLQGALNAKNDSKITLTPMGSDHQFTVAFERANYGHFCVSIQPLVPSMARSKELASIIRSSAIGDFEGDPNKDFAWWRYGGSSTSTSTPRSIGDWTQRRGRLSATAN